MATTHTALLLSLFLLASAAAALARSGKEDPELEHCRRQCRQTEHLSEREVRECVSRCEESAKKKERRREAGDDVVLLLSQGGPEERLQQCRQRCETEHRDDPDQCAQCRRRCQERYEEERRREPGGRGSEGEDAAVLEQGSPEERLRECQRQCETQHRHDRGQRDQCERRCLERYEEEERREHRGRGGGGDNDDEEEGPQERLRQCRRQCKSEGHSAGEQSQCESRCQERYEKEQRERGGGGEPNDDAGREEEAEEKQQEAGKSPFFFDRQSFRHRVRTDHGSVRVLERFTERSELLRAMENYRLAFLEANPNAFVLPHHIDADTIYYVANGRGTIKLLRGGENRRESHSVRRGDIITIAAGTVVYMVNTDSDEKLHIVMLLRTVSAPGNAREFFGVGGEDPESFLRSFSDELLQAAFKARKESVDRMFGKLKKGAIVGASKEQVHAMSHGGDSSEGGREESTRHFNLQSKRPSHSSRHGQHYEATADDCPELRDVDVHVSFANITGGSMTALYYLTRATQLIVVLEGGGYAEMACPHMAGEREGKEEGEKRGAQVKRAHYQKVRSRLLSGTAIIVPAGHPVAVVASGRRNLQVLCFEINAKNNQRIFVAGRNSILKLLESEAKELSFDRPAREVDEFLGGQQESEMITGPEQRQEKSLKWGGSILDFAGL